jgi:hypothetical protein
VNETIAKFTNAEDFESDEPSDYEIEPLGVISATLQNSITEVELNRKIVELDIQDPFYHFVAKEAAVCQATDLNDYKERISKLRNTDKAFLKAFKLVKQPTEAICENRYVDSKGVQTFFSHSPENINHAKNRIA